ncbi:hypothetical protein MI467_08615 [Delftia acidovorans]|uniref:hypothetical protein n=1 Tax=Delftia TaxID=80865 RepID=UPI00114E6BFD|nr:MULTISPECIES: hypothetical protein [Delftia]MBJ2142229.1 hypothetical protein [Delftia acidovorans]MCB4785979.1 hypothetical protein [Delftia sp. Lp-1]MCG8986908.1 hypothetical protein [Delftia acidovorans]
MIYANKNHSQINPELSLELEKACVLRFSPAELVSDVVPLKKNAPAAEAAGALNGAFHAINPGRTHARGFE